MRQHPARLLHPLRRHHLRRRPDAGVGDPADGSGLAQRLPGRGAGQAEGGRDAARVPRQLPLQPAATRTCAASTPRCRRSGSGTTTRSPTTGRTARTSRRRPLHREARADAGRAAPRAPSSSTRPCAGTRRTESERVYRHIPYGPDLDVFVIDMRSYRGPNTFNRQEAPGAETAFLGRAQIEWLKRKLERVARHLEGRSPPTCPSACWSATAWTPQGAPAVRRPRQRQRPGARPRVRDRRPAALHQARATSRNVVWLTADVHYCAAHHYDPSRARFQDFDPFWEFVAGPAERRAPSAPTSLDDTFGPQVVFQKAPPAGPGQPAADRRSAVLRPGRHRSAQRRPGGRRCAISPGNTLFSQRLEARAGSHRFDDWAAPTQTHGFCSKEMDPS